MYHGRLDIATCPLQFGCRKELASRLRYAKVMVEKLIDKLLPADSKAQPAAHQTGAAAVKTCN